MKTRERSLPLLVLCVSVVVAGCASSPGNYTGKLSRDTMLGIVPAECDMALYFDIGNVDWEEPVMGGLVSVLEGWSKTIQVYDFDFKNDLYSLYLGIKTAGQGGENIQVFAAANHAFTRDIALKRYSDSEFRIVYEDVNRNYIELKNDAQQYTAALLGESVTVASTNFYAWALRENAADVRSIKRERIRSMMNEAGTDAIVVCVIPYLFPFIDTVRERQGNNPIYDLFGEEDAFSFSVSMAKNGYEVNGLLYVGDEKRKKQLLGLINLMMLVADTTGDMDDDVKGIIKSIDAEDDPIGIRISLFMDSKLIADLVHKYANRFAGMY